MLLLFVEDDERAIAQVRKRVEKEHNDIVCEVKNFEEAGRWLVHNSPDIISLDLLNGGLSGEAEVAGQTVYNQVWNEHFCPVIVYSAQPDACEDERQKEHPFLKTVKKGRGSPDEFSTAIKGFRPQVDALRIGNRTREPL